MVSAGYGLDYSAAVDILRTIRSANGFTVTIVLKPFSFEGQRRQDEVVNGMQLVLETPCDNESLFFSFKKNSAL